LEPPAVMQPPFVPPVSAPPAANQHIGPAAPPGANAVVPAPAGEETLETTLNRLFVSNADAKIGIRRAVSVCVSEDNIFNHLVLQAESQKTKKTMNANRDKAVAIDEANYTTVFNEPVVQLLQGVFPEIHYDPKKQCFWPDTTGIRQKLITGLQAR